MNLTPRQRALLLVVDGIGLVGVIAFTVLAALDRDSRVYLVGQIVSAAVVLGAALLLRSAGDTSDPPPDES